MAYKLCPKCKEKRPSHETYCEGLIQGQICGWTLVDVDLFVDEVTEEEEQQTISLDNNLDQSNHLKCSQGHTIPAGDFICPNCGETLNQEPIQNTHPNFEPTFDPSKTGKQVDQKPVALPKIDPWQALEQVDIISKTSTRYVVENLENGIRGYLTLYKPGTQPDSSIYQAIARIDKQYVATILETGHWQDQAYEISEFFPEGNIQNLKLNQNDPAKLKNFIEEIGNALDSLHEIGLRHRNLSPDVIFIRSLEPLVLVISGFSEASLSEFDLDIVSPSETTKYMAPEVLPGAVTSQSDWWSLGIILLEKLTNGTCFDGINDQAFLIHVISSDIPLPSELAPEIDHLLRGLIVRDRSIRWAWPEVNSWLEGAPPEAPARDQMAATNTGPVLILNDQSHFRIIDYSQAAAKSENWQEALDHLLLGQIASWAEDLGLEEQRLSNLRGLAAQEIEDDFKLALALKILNKDFPLVIRGELVNGAWLMQYPDDGYRLLESKVPNLLSETGQNDELWLSHLKKRIEAVQTRAQNYEIELNENELKIYLLSTSHANLLSLWNKRREIFPDSQHRGLSAIAERRSLSDEDLIILLSATLQQFLSVEAVISEAVDLARKVGISDFDPDPSRQLIETQPRQEIIDTVTDRIADFAYCGIQRIDEWSDAFRHSRRMPLARALVILSIDINQWQRPEKQEYVSSLISFFEQKIANNIKRGPLARLTITGNSRNIDLLELDSNRQPALRLLDLIIDRSSQATTLDPTLFTQFPRLDARLRGLSQKANSFKRDTGIDGLFLGFPFLLYQPQGQIKPRIAPILLWPVRLESEIGAHGIHRFSFDDVRQEIRFNPALENFLDSNTLKKWQEAANHAIEHSFCANDVIQDFKALAHLVSPDLSRIPANDASAPQGEAILSYSAALFHISFMGQAVLEDLRLLQQSPLKETSLEVLLRMENAPLNSDYQQIAVQEQDQYLTLSSDPSQKEAVIKSRNGAGLVIEGPPGTGKSQTIVNLIGDAIGRKKSLLLVCQKQAALDVVSKRLEAEGLGNRFVMVKDANSDRQSTIRSIREQLNNLFQNLDQNNRPIKLREQQAQRIEALEQELDKYHQALYNFDDEIGRNYRDIISELVDLEERDFPPIDCISIRTLANKFPLESIIEIEEDIAPLGLDWIEADFYQSPLISLKPFHWDEATYQAFCKDFDAFLMAERARHSAIAHKQSLYGIKNFSDKHLARWIITAKRATKPRAFYSYLNPLRYFANRRLSKFIETCNAESSEINMQQFLLAVTKERDVRIELEKHGKMSLEILKPLDHWFEDHWIEQLQQTINSRKNSFGIIDPIQNNKTYIPAYQKFRVKSQNLSDDCWLFIEALGNAFENFKRLPKNQIDKEIRRTIDREIRLAWKARLEKNNPALIYEQSQIEAKIKALKDADSIMKKLNKEYLTSGISMREISSRQKWEDITRLNGPRSLRLREFIDRGIDLGLFELRPIWLMNPEVASRLLPNNRAMFDYVVFDEASQMPIELALPTLYRGRCAIISGDEKQLPPSAFFSGQIENDEQEDLDDLFQNENLNEDELAALDEAWNRKEIKDCPDLLALGRSVLPNSLLQVHYRSNYRELIAYSNAAFYGNRLNVHVQHPDNEILRVKPIEVIRVDGVYQEQTNSDEADEIVQLLQNYWQKPQRPTIGVVTFNIKQAKLIEERLEALAENDSVFKSAYLHELNRQEAGEDMGFFVKNVENVQGDERDIILFSTTFGKNSLGQFRRNFGVLGQNGGERRLNVAISRAREKILLVTSMPVDAISDLFYTQRKPETPRDYLQGYLKFAEFLHQGDFIQASDLLRKVQTIPSEIDKKLDKKDGFKRIVENHISDLGYSVEYQNDGSAFAIDFAIRHPKTGLYGIGIECDAPQHQLLNHARDREIWRNEMLTKSLYKVHRVSSYGWYHARHDEQDALREAIEQALA